MGLIVVILTMFAICYETNRGGVLRQKITRLRDSQWFQQGCGKLHVLVALLFRYFLLGE